VIPDRLTAEVVRYFGKDIVETRTLPVLSVVPGGPKLCDLIVEIHWARGRGVVEFSLLKGYLAKRGGQSVPWRLSVESARAILSAFEVDHVAPKLFDQSTWWAHDPSMDRLPPEVRDCLGHSGPHAQKHH
jgi:hypothetical protein